MKASDHIFCLTVQGTSMAPILRRGDVIFLEKIHNLPLPGAIIAYRNDKNQIICHRYHYAQGGRLYCKGDNVNKFDKPIAISQVLGQVFQIKRQNGQILTTADFPLPLIKILQQRLIGPLAALESGRKLLTLGNRLYCHYLKVRRFCGQYRPR